MNQETQDTENSTKKLKRWEESRVDNQETQDTENSTKKLKRWEESRDTRHGKLNKETKKMR